MAAAIEVLDDIARRHRPATEALKDWGVSHRFAGAGDRAAIGNIVHDALRHRRSAGWLMQDDTPRGLVFGALLIDWDMTPGAIAEALVDDRFAPQPLSESERAAVEARRLADAPDGVRADVPGWCAPILETCFGDAWVAEGAALAARPPLDLRVNTLKCDRDRVAAELARTGAAPTPLAADGLRIAPATGSARHPNIQAEPAFRKGWFEVQDEGSQVTAALAGAQPGEQVLDYCAGAGGKTLTLSARMDNRGQVFAFDAEKARLAPIFERLKRAGCRNVQVVADAAALETHHGAFDCVLVDAPCTGSGTWRRRPDAKWRLSARQLEARRGEQAAILDAAAPFVKPGGRLAYITCSLFREENHDQVAAFLARDAAFAAIDHDALWQGAHSGRDHRARVEAATGIVLSPARSGTDGFFIAVMERR